MNTWQSGSAEALARNRATLEGMTAYLRLPRRPGRASTRPTSSGRRSSATVADDSNLAGRDSWLAGSVAAGRREVELLDAPLVPGGRVTLTQYVRDDLDRNHSCG